MICNTLPIFSGDEIETKEMGGHVACMGERRVVYRVLVGNLREGNRLEEAGVDGRIILRWIFRRWDLRHGKDRSGSR